MASVKLLFLVFLISFVYEISCIPHHTADHSNHCHANGESEIIHIEVGESASLPGKCQQVTCQKDFSLSALTCAAHIPKDGCKLSDIDYKKPYPDCCPQEICPSKN